MANLTCSLETISGKSFIPGNRVEILRNGNEIFPAMLEAIENSREHIDFLTYVYWQGDIAIKFANALAERARAGVEVKVLLDAIGAFRMSRQLIEVMNSAGVKVLHFRPLARWRFWDWDNRTHRKLLICDCSVAFTGGVGIASEWEGDARDSTEWRDTHFRVTGPAVQSIHSGFISNWNEAENSSDIYIPDYKPAAAAGSARILPVEAPSSYNWSDVALIFRALLANAKASICIATAYFVPDPILTDLFCKAAQKGVKIQVLIPGDNTDSRLSQFSGRSTFQTLLNAGVTICRFQPSMLHTKILLVDDTIAVVGSANMNHRSMAKDEECCLIIDDAETLRTLTRHFLGDLERSEPLDINHWRRRPQWQRISEKLAYLFRFEV